MKHPLLRSVPFLLAAALVHAATPASYPTKPIRIIATSTPGSGPDIIARLIGQKLTEAWGQAVVVEPRPGASGMIGAEIAARASPDGYTFMIATSQHAIVNAMYENRNYDIVKDFASVSLMASTPFLLVTNASVSANSVKELIALAQAKPGALKYGSGGSGSPPHLATEILKSMTHIDLLHVPYKGVTPALNDTVAGHVQITVSVVPACLALVRAGKVKALGITSAKRSKIVPDIPAIAETVPGYEFVGWYSIVAPARTPAAIIAKTNAEVVKALKAPELQERLAALGAEPLGTTPQELDAFLRAQVENMAKAVKESGARPDA